MRYLIFIVPGLCALAVLIAHARSGRPIRSIVSSLVQGGVSLLAVNAIGSFTGVRVAVNPWTLGAAGVFGMPGTITLVLLGAIFHL